METYLIPDDGKEYDLIRSSLVYYREVVDHYLLNMIDTLLSQIENGNRWITNMPHSGVIIKQAIAHLLKTEKDYKFIIYMKHVFPLLPKWLIPDNKDA